jgi:hypothetical protein
MSGYFVKRKKRMSEPTNVVKMSPVSLPMSAEEMAGDAALGGKVGFRDISVPYLYILQGLSPQVQPASPKFIKGAAISQFYLTVTDDIIDGNEGVDVVSCYYERVVNEWVDRNKGGGLVATHNPESNIMESAKATDPSKPGMLYLPNGHLVVETAYHYLLVKRGAWGHCVFPLKSTALKHSRKWNSNINTLLIPDTNKPAPRFLYQWRLTTIAESKLDKIWYSPAWKQGEPVNRETYAMAREYARMAATGMLRRPMEEFEADEVGETNVL